MGELHNYIRRTEKKNNEMLKEFKYNISSSGGGFS